MKGISDIHWERIHHHFSKENIPSDRKGRKPVPTRAVLDAVFWILNTGAQWHTLPQYYPNYKTVHRRFQKWCHDETLRQVLMDLANELRGENGLDESWLLTDAIFSSVKGGDVEKTRQGKESKIMVMVGSHDFLLVVTAHVFNDHEMFLVQLTFDFYMVEEWPKKPIGGSSYDGDSLDEEFKEKDIDLHNVTQTIFILRE